MKKLMAMFMVLCMMVSTFGMTAFASDSSADESISATGNDTLSETVTESSTVDGVTTDVTATTTTTTDENGNVTVNLKIESTSAGTNSAGETITGEETYEQTTVTDAEGNVVSDDWVVDGSETKEWTEEDSGDEAGQPVVEAPVVPGETTVATGGVTTVTTENEDGSVTTTTTTDRTVTTTTTKAEVTVNETDTGLVGDAETVLNGPAPVYDEDDDLHINPKNGQPLDKVNGEHVGKEDVFDRNYLSSDSKYNDPSKWTDMPDEAEFRYVGTGEHSKFYNARVTVIFAKDENGNPIMDENGNYMIESIQKKDGTIVTIDGVPATELPDEVSLKPIFDNYNGGRPTTFMLMDKNGNKVYAYCCDMDTGANKGTYYTVTNLEDSDYYASEESEEHIRSIVMNGYWGTTDVPKEDGSYEFGSLEGIKAKLKAAINNGDMENEIIQMIVTDSEGNETVVTKTMLELLDELTEGEALLATQSAIWSYSNGSLAVKNGKDGVVVIDPDGYMMNHDPAIGSKDGEAMDDFGSARVDFLYKWLIALETEEESTVVINEKNFVEDVSLSIGDKVSDAKENQDDNKDNDVYHSALNFKLAFVPGENDDLLVQITYKDLDGKDVTIVRRLAGENAEGQSYEDIKPEADGSYVLKGLKLSENKDFAFDLRLEGTQYLENGVYVYQAVGGRDVSQTFVGVAEGTRNVDVSIGVTVKFDVDENNHVVAQRVWHDEGDPVAAPAEAANAGVFALAVHRPLDNIPDEEVPLADAPQTGDEVVFFGILTVLAGISLLAMHVSEKKRKDEV